MLRRNVSTIAAVIFAGLSIYLMFEVQYWREEAFKATAEHEKTIKKFNAPKPKEVWP